MAEATTADLLKAQEETTKKIAFVGNVLNKNIVPASAQKEKDAEANIWKKKLFGFLSGIKDSLTNMAKRTLQVAGFPIAIIMGAIAFIISFFMEIGRQLGKLRKVFTGIKNLPKLIAGFFAAIRNGLVLAREAVVAKIAGALKAFKGTDGFKRLASGLDDLADVYRLAREAVVTKINNALKVFKESKMVGRITGAFTRLRFALNSAKWAVIGKINGALAAFKESKMVAAITGAFTRMKFALSSAKWFVIGKLNAALAVFKESSIVKAIGGAFKTIGGMFGRAIGVGKGVTGGIVGAVRGAMVAFRESAIFKTIGGIGKVLSGAFAGVLSMIGGAAKAATGPRGMGAKAGKGIVGAISKVTGAIGGMVNTIGKFTGLKSIVSFAARFGTILGKLLWPVTIIIGLFDFIKGFRKDEGWDGEPASFFTKIGMGISEALQGLIGLPLDMIKAGILWILGKFGIGKTKDPVTGEEMESAWMTKMKEFSFSDLIDDLIGGIWGGMQAVIDWVGKLFSDPVATLKEAGKAVLSAFTNFGTWLWDNSIGKAIGWVKDLLGIEDKEEKPASSGEAKEVESKGWLSWIMDTILPKGLVDFIKAPIATILGWIGLGGDTTTDGDTKPKELEGATGKPEGGWFSAILGKIFSPTLLLFLLGPVGWILGFLGFLVKAAGATADTGTTGDSSLDAAKGKGEKNMFAKFLEAILPAGLIAFVTDPVDWILKFIGWKDAEGKTTGAGADAALVITKGSFSDKVNLFKDVIWSILPEGLRNFFKLGPVNWILQKLGWQSAEGELTEKGVAGAETLKHGTFSDKAKMFKDIIWSILPGGLKDFFEKGPIEWIKEKIFGPSKTKATDSSADSFFANWKLPSWDSFKELLPKWLSDPVGWVTGLFKKGEEVGAEEKARLEGAEDTKRRQDIRHAKDITEKGGTLTGKEEDAYKKAVKYMQEQAEEMGVVNLNWSGESVIDQGAMKAAVRSGEMTLEMLEAITAYDTGERNTKDAIAKEFSKKTRGSETLSDQDLLLDLIKTLEPLEEGTKPTSNSFFVHDVHVEKAIYGLMQGALAQTQLLAAYGSGSGSGGGTTVNNVTVSPSTSNTVSSVQKSENTYGTVDPYTSASGAYG